MTETQPTYARAGRPLIHYIENERAHQLHTFTTRMHTVENRPANLHTYGHMQSPKFPQICCRAKNMSRVHLQVKLDAAKNSIVFLLTFQNSVNYFQYENHHFSIPKDTPLNQTKSFLILILNLVQHLEWLRNETEVVTFKEDLKRIVSKCSIVYCAALNSKSNRAWV